MSSQHLSDEAVAAFADGVLRGHARERATRHTDRCADCARAVAVQREAVWALRAAPAPALPGGLLDRLKALPDTTPPSGPPVMIDRDGSAVFAAFGTAGMAALAPTDTSQGTRHRRRTLPLLLTASAIAAAGVVTVASTAPASSSAGTPSGRLPTTSAVDSGGVVVTPLTFQHPYQR